MTSEGEQGLIRLGEGRRAESKGEWGMKAVKEGEWRMREEWENK